MPTAPGVTPASSTRFDRVDALDEIGRSVRALARQVGAGTPIATASPLAAHGLALTTPMVTVLSALGVPRELAAAWAASLARTIGASPASDVALGVVLFARGRRAGCALDRLGVQMRAYARSLA